MDTATFVGHLQECGLLMDRRLSHALEELSGPDADGRALARELIQRDLLTPFQANHLLTGKAQSLIVGQYCLVERLGHKSSVKSFKALHISMARPVTVQLFTPFQDAELSTRNGFNAAVRQLAQLHHPNILRAFDAFDFNGIPVFVTEYVDGTNLARFVRNTGVLPARLACHFLLQAALAVQHAHERGLNCCRIRPENILIAGYQLKEVPSNLAGPNTGIPRGMVKLIDLGLNIFFDSFPNGPVGQLFDESDGEERVNYLAPEQLQDHRAGDARSDVYLLGAILYFALTARHPFAEGQQSMQGLSPPLDSSLANSIRGMMAVDPDQRPQTAAELADELVPFAAIGSDRNRN